MKAMTRLTALGVILALVSGGSAQQYGAKQKPKPKGMGGGGAGSSKAKSKLEQALADAYKYNPDLRVAQAELTLADAKLAQAKSQLAQKVVKAYHNVQTAEAALRSAEAKAARVKRLVGIKASSKEDAEAAIYEALRAKTALAAAQSALDYLVGKPTAQPVSVRVRLWDPDSGKADTTNSFLRQIGRNDAEVLGRWLGQSVKGAVADKIKKALDRKVSVSFVNKPASEALKALEKEFGLTIQTPGKNKKLGDSSPWDEKLTAKLSDVPLGAAFQLLEDTLDGYRIVVREYGLLIVAQDKVPPGAMTMTQFWKGEKKDDKADTKKPKK